MTHEELAKRIQETQEDTSLYLNSARRCVSAEQAYYDYKALCQLIDSERELMITYYRLNMQTRNILFANANAMLKTALENCDVELAEIALEFIRLTDSLNPFL